MMMMTWPAMTLEEVLERFEGDQAPQIERLYNEGKQVLVYENVDLGSPAVGHCVAVTWPLEDELPEPTKPFPYELPAGLMHWRYYPLGYLVGKETS